MAKEKMEKVNSEAIEAKGKKERQKGSLIKNILIVFLSLVFLLLLFLLLLRLNVFGLGNILAPSMRNWPLSQVYLPSMTETGEIELDPETGEPIVKEPEETLEEVKEKLNLMEMELKKKEEEADILLKQVQKLKTENERLAVFEKNQLKYEKDKEELDRLIVESGDKAAFVQWYESINPDNAARLYQESVATLEEQEELGKLTKVYAEMKPKAAAKVLETMSSTRLEMVAMIIKNLDTDQAGKIMSEMEAKVAARVTAYLYPER